MHVMITGRVYTPYYEINLGAREPIPSYNQGMYEEWNEYAKPGQLFLFSSPNIFIRLSDLKMLFDQYHYEYGRWKHMF